MTTVLDPFEEPTGTPTPPRKPLAPLLIVLFAGVVAVPVGLCAGADIALGVFGIIAEVGIELWGHYGHRR
ncbi:hypothetical protein [Nocardia macrotermitis]|uniref:Uncharacterized protein n=1 Tax=Nocardia macrotermitis TaxID=2585198 RepID=A0A7K0D8E8_9NOCA|nr:hypothetical protein [Nocardia macrotermitis]MQY22036.1 hypothetical protein [Nocardia macrotermitis]